MSPISTAEFIEACESNLSIKSLSFAQLPGGEVHGTNPTWFVSGSRLAGYNGVVKASFPREEVDEAIEATMLPFRQRGLSFTWWTGPSSGPSNLPTRLQQHGFIHNRDMLGMAADIRELTAPYDNLPILKVEPVTTPEKLYEWHPLYMQGFNSPASIARESLEVMSALSFKADAAWSHYLARENGHLIAISSLYINDGIAGLYNLVTTPEDRGRGIGAAMTLQTYAIARDLGCQIATLQTTYPNALRLYHRLGFEVYCKFGIYQFIR